MSSPEMDPNLATGNEVNSEARNWGMLCHLSALLGHFAVLGGVIGPLIVWLIKKDQFPFVDFCGKEAVNFNITLLIAILVSAPTLCIFIGVVLVPAVYIFGVVMSIIAAMKASNGEYYRYPVSIRLIQ